MEQIALRNPFFIPLGNFPSQGKRGEKRTKRFDLY